MESLKTKSLRNLEQKMEGMDRDSLRYLVLESAKHFKTSWVELGRSLYSVWKDRLYKGWGYTTFDAYASKEAGIRKQTAMKLLRSYYFLEKEEPAYLREGYAESVEAARVPGYESIDVLRLAKNKKRWEKRNTVTLKKRFLKKGAISAR